MNICAAIRQMIRIVINYKVSDKYLSRKGKLHEFDDYNRAIKLKELMKQEEFSNYHVANKKINTNERKNKC